MKIFQKDIRNKKRSRKLTHLLLTIAIPILVSGCLEANKTPESTFRGFLKAIENDNREKALSYVLPQAKVSSSIHQSKNVWFEKMKLDTLESNPKFVRIEWIRRGYKAKAFYSYSEHQNEDYLIMVYDKNQWWIELSEIFNGSRNFNEIRPIKPSKPSIK